MGCTTGLIKSVVFTFNFLFVLTGLVYIANGVILIRYYDLKTIDDSLYIAPLLSIAVGSIVFVIAFLGCCGTLKNDTCLLSTYAFILITLLVFQVALGVFIYLQILNTGNMNEIVEKGLQDVFKRYKTDPVAKGFFDGTQATLSCCGVNGPSDYMALTLPMSCCGKTQNVCTVVNGGWKNGCSEAILNGIMTYSKIIGQVILAVCCIELVGSILVLYLIGTINNHRRRFAYA